MFMVEQTGEAALPLWRVSVLAPTHSPQVVPQEVVVEGEEEGAPPLQVQP